MTNSGRLKFILFITVTSTIGQMAAEVYVPSLPYIGHEFGVSNKLVQLSIAMFLFGMAVPAIFFGYISDFFGRRKILILSTSIGLLGSLICMLAPNIYMLILGRLVQGAGFSGVGSLSRAILRDKMSGVELAKFVSNMAIINVLLIDLSPLVGGVIQEYFGWRPIFGLILLYNMLAIYLSVNYKEQQDSQLNASLDLHRIFHNAWEVLKDPVFVKYNLMAGLNYSVIMVYLAVASFLFENKLGLTPQQFGITTFGLSFVYMVGAFLNGRLLHRYSMDRLILNGIFIMFVATIWVFLIATIIPLTYWGLVLFVALIYLGASAIFSNSSAQAFGVMNKGVGIASALYSALQIFIAAIATTLISYFHTQSTFPLAIIMFAISISMLLIFQMGRKN